MTAEEARAVVEKERDEAAREGARVDKAAVCEWFMGLLDTIGEDEARRDYNTTEAAFHLGYTPVHVARLCKRGAIRGAYQNGDGGEWRIPRLDLEGFRRDRQKNKPKKLWEKSA